MWQGLKVNVTLCEFLRSHWGTHGFGHYCPALNLDPQGSVRNRWSGLADPNTCEYSHESTHSYPWVSLTHATLPVSTLFLLLRGKRQKPMQRLPKKVSRLLPNSVSTVSFSDLSLLSPKYAYPQTIGNYSCIQWLHIQCPLCRYCRFRGNR